MRRFRRRRIATSALVALVALVAVVALVAIAAVLRGSAGADICPRATKDPSGGPDAAPFRSAISLGAAVRWKLVQSSPGYAAFYLAHYTWMTPENELKMNALQPNSGHFDFATADAMIAWAAKHGKHVHGHTLIWGTDLPEWATRLREHTPTAAGRARTLKALGTHVVTVLRHFHGRIGEWDVVNEAFRTDGRPVDNVWYHELGPAYIEDAFRAARLTDPQLRLCYNDLGTELPGPHASAVLAMVRRLRAAHLLDCVGFEMHVAVPNPGPTGFAEVLKSFAATGADLLVSELDVVPPVAQPGATAPHLSESQFLSGQATVYGNVADVCRAQARCVRLTTWGFTDAATWLGSAAQPLPFDTRCAAKPAWGALRRTLTGSAA